MTDSGTEPPPDPAPAIDETARNGEIEPATSRTQQWVARARTRATTDAKRATAWVEGTQTRKLTYDFAVDLAKRDQDAFASVLGSAIALRLFLFTASITVVLVSLLNLILGDWGIDRALNSAGMAGTIVLNAVVFERFGSISEFTFSLPFIRRIPDRFPSVARFFDLERQREPRAEADAAIDTGATDTEATDTEATDT